jgi:hypothetical protein
VTTTVSPSDIVVRTDYRARPAKVMDDCVTALRKAGVPAFRLGIPLNDEVVNGERPCGLVFAAGRVYMLSLDTMAHRPAFVLEVPILVRPADGLTNANYRWTSAETHIVLHIDSPLSEVERTGVTSLFTDWFEALVMDQKSRLPIVEFEEPRDRPGHTDLGLCISELLLSAEAAAHHAQDLVNGYFTDHPRRLFPFLRTATGALCTGRGWMPQRPTVRRGARRHYE